MLTIRRVQIQSRPFLTGYCSSVECFYRSKSEEILSDNYRESLFMIMQFNEKSNGRPPKP
jgi:hypothetical protein